MKKQYIEPQMKTISVRVPQMICQSLGLNGKASVNGVTSADSRQENGLWDDDDEY